MAGQPLLLIARACDFAARRHAHQHRKGEALEPYVNHLAEVAMLLAEATQGNDAALIAAGYLHDSLEDTDTTFEELTSQFGSDVAALVRAVTDDTTLSRDERKRLQITGIGAKTERAQLLKIADQTSNLRSLLSSPPPDWDAARKLQYAGWAAQIVAAATVRNAVLQNYFNEAHAALLVAHADAAVPQDKAS